MSRVRHDRKKIGEGVAFHRSSPDGDHGEKADLHSPEKLVIITRYSMLLKVGDCCESRNTLMASNTI